MNRERERRRRIASLLSPLFLLLLFNLFLVFVLPGIVGYPAGGMLLINVLFPFAVVLVGLGVLGGLYLLTAGRKWFGLAVGIAVPLALVALGLANAYLWMLCVSSV